MFCRRRAKLRAPERDQCEARRSRGNADPLLIVRQNSASLSLIRGSPQHKAGEKKKEDSPAPGRTSHRRARARADDRVGRVVSPSPRVTLRSLAMLFVELEVSVARVFARYVVRLLGGEEAK